MASRCLELIWAVFIVYLALVQPARSVSVEQLLFKDLFTDYQKIVRPVLRSNQAINISISFRLRKISEVNERRQILTTHVEFYQRWIDPRLAWNPAVYENFTSLSVPCQLIWLPDLVLYNSVEDQSRDFHEPQAIVRSDGKVSWPPIVLFKSSCEMDISLFPFDEQICSLKLGSSGYDELQLNLLRKNSGLELGTYVKNSEWDIKDTHVVKNVAYYPCCIEPFSDITFYIHIRRRHFYYTLNLIFPCIFLSTLPIFSFALPPDSCERVALGLSVLVAYSVFMLLIVEIMPHTSQFTPLIGIYLIISMGLTSCIVIFSILVLNLHHRGVTNGRPPALLYHLVVRRLGRVLCVSQKSSEMFTHAFGSVFPTSRRYQMLRGRNLAAAASAVGNLRKNERGDSMDVDPVAELEMGVDMLTVSTCSIDKKAAAENNKTKNHNNKQSAVNQTRLTALNHLQYMDLKQARIEEETTCIREWQLIALVLDRLLLACFVILLAASSGYLLLLKPSLTKAKSIPRS